MRRLGRALSTAAKAYGGLYLGLVLLLSLPLLHRFTPLKAPALLRALLGATAVAVLHFSAAVGPVAAPWTAGAVTALLLAPIALLRRSWALRLARGRVLTLLLPLFALLNVAGFAAFVGAMRGFAPPGHAPDEPPEVRLVAPLERCYEIEVLGETGALAALCRGDFSVHRVDPREGRVEASAAFPGTFYPHGAVYDAPTRRLFAVGYDGEHEGDTPGVAVIRGDTFAIESWLPMPGCWNAINVDIDRATGALVALCEARGSLYHYDLATLATRSIGRLPDGVMAAGYDLEFLGGDAAVSGGPWPNAFHAIAATPESARPWRAFRLRSMPYGITSDPRARRFYLASPLERRIDAFDADDFRRVGGLATEGMVRNMAVDPQRGRLFSGSYFRGVVEAFDLASGERVGRWRVGPLLRGIAWDPRAQRLYVASAEGLYEIAVD